MIDIEWRKVPIRTQKSPQYKNLQHTQNTQQIQNQHELLK